MSGEVERAVDQAMHEQRVPAWYRESVLGMMAEPRESWPACCGNDCEPCVLVLGRVVDRARELLENHD
jgi:hypothetical protein